MVLKKQENLQVWFCEGHSEPPKYLGFLEMPLNKKER